MYCQIYASYCTNPVQGQRRSAANAKRSRVMLVPMSFMGGIILGIVLFFVLERTGIVYKWFDKWDN
jgi:hypothetical protein